jgi:hypothetical protein
VAGEKAIRERRLQRRDNEYFSVFTREWCRESREKESHASLSKSSFALFVKMNNGCKLSKSNERQSWEDCQNLSPYTVFDFCSHLCRYMRYALECGIEGQE